MVLHVEGAEPLFHQVVEVRGERRLLDVVFALQDVDSVDRTGRDLLANGGGRGDQNASRIALTIVRANSALMRSSALRSC